MGSEATNSSAGAHDLVRTAIHAERRSRRFENKRRYERDARATLRASLNSAENFRSLFGFATLLCRVARELEAAGITADLPQGTAAQRVGRELLALAREGDVVEVARRAHRRMFEFYEPLEEDYHYAAPSHMLARWRRGGIRQAYKLVRKFLKAPDIPHNRANWQHVAGLHYLRVEFWHDIGALADFEEEGGVLLDPREPLSSDDPGLPFPALCAMTADDLREFLTTRARECMARVPLRVRRNINRVRRGSAGNAIINKTPCDLTKSSNEVCLRLIEELDRMARIAAWTPGLPDLAQPNNDAGVKASPASDASVFAKVVDVLRKPENHGLTITDIAKKAGVSRSQIYRCKELEPYLEAIRKRQHDTLADHAERRWPAKRGKTPLEDSDALDEDECDEECDTEEDGDEDK